MDALVVTMAYKPEAMTAEAMRRRSEGEHVHELRRPRNVAIPDLHAHIAALDRAPYAKDAPGA